MLDNAYELDLYAPLALLSRERSDLPLCGIIAESFPDDPGSRVIFRNRTNSAVETGGDGGGPISIAPGGREFAVASGFVTTVGVAVFRLGGGTWERVQSVGAGLWRRCYTERDTVDLAVSTVGNPGFADDRLDVVVRRGSGSTSSFQLFLEPADTISSIV